MAYGAKKEPVSEIPSPTNGLRGIGKTEAVSMCHSERSEESKAAALLEGIDFRFLVAPLLGMTMGITRNDNWYHTYKGEGGGWEID